MLEINLLWLIYFSLSLKSRERKTLENYKAEQLMNQIVYLKASSEENFSSYTHKIVSATIYFTSDFNLNIIHDPQHYTPRSYLYYFFTPSLN